jgi:hypothetical protein
MAELEAKKAWQANELLMNDMHEFREDTKAQIDAMVEEMAELMRGMLAHLLLETTTLCILLKFNLKLA